MRDSYGPFLYKHWIADKILELCDPIFTGYGISKFIIVPILPSIFMVFRLLRKEKLNFDEWIAIIIVIIMWLVYIRMQIKLTYAV